MYIILYTLLSLACLEAHPMISEWKNYKNQFNLKFEKEEELYRKGIFEKNYEFIQSENQKGHSYKLAINEFAHLTDDEFHENYLSIPLENAFVDEDFPELNRNPNFEVDWRKKGVVSPIRNQGQCGSCYAFGVMAAIESMVALKTGKLNVFSPQQIVDCSELDFGCDGGLEDSSYNYLMKSGIELEESYKYEAERSTCRYNKEAVVARISGYIQIASGERALSLALRRNPLTVRLYASLNSFRFYSSGVYYDPKCTSSATNHLVLAVGFVHNETDNYYIIKNSWSTRWGVDGYFYLARWKRHNCGVATLSTYPILS